MLKYYKSIKCYVQCDNQGVGRTVSFFLLRCLPVVCIVIILKICIIIIIIIIRKYTYTSSCVHIITGTLLPVNVYHEVVYYEARLRKIADFIALCLKHFVRN